MSLGTVLLIVLILLLLGVILYRPRFLGHVVEGKSGRLPPGSDEPFLAHLRG
jgi:hypothetical protein